MDQIDIAVHDTLHNSGMEPKKIADNMGMGHQILLNKANPNSEFHKLTLREAIGLMKITGSTRILDAMAAELGVDKPTQEKLPIPGVLEAVLVATAEHGDVVNVIRQSLADGRFTLREKESCQKEIGEAMEALSILQPAVVVHK